MERGWVSICGSCATSLRGSRRRGGGKMSLTELLIIVIIYGPGPLGDCLVMLRFWSLLIVPAQAECRES